MNHIIIDWETLSRDTTKPYVVSLGYAVFNPYAYGIEEVGFWKFDIEASAKELGSYICPNTLKWWLEQDIDIAKKSLGEHTGDVIFHIKTAIEGLHILGEQEDITHSWGHGKEFDLGIFISIYTKLMGPFIHMDNAFTFRRQCDTRTLFTMAGVDHKAFSAIHRLKDDKHNPVSDCIIIAEAIQLAYRNLQIQPPILPMHSGLSDDIPF